MYLLMDKIVEQMSNFWTVTTNDSYCCDSVEPWVFSYEKPVNIMYSSDVYVIPVQQNFKSQMEHMERNDFFNPRAIFILVHFSDQCGIIGENNQTTKIFNIMWLRNLFVTSLLIISECNGGLTLITAKPFSNENTCRTIQRNGMKYFYLRPDEKEFDFELFQEQPTDFKNLHGCSFWAGTLPLAPYVVGKPVTVDNETLYEYIGGIDVELMHLLSSRLNFTYKFYKTEGYDMDAWFKMLPNGTVVGIFQDVLYHHIDIAFGGIVPSYATYYKFEYSSSYKFSSLSWYVNDPNIVPQWQITFRVFPPEIWLILCLIYLTVCFLYFWMDYYRFNGSKTLNSNFKMIPFSNFFSIGLGLSSTLKPKSFHLRALFISWATYSLHWSIAYTSLLFILITNPPLEKEIKTIQDLKDSGLKVSIDAIYLEFFGHYEIDERARSLLNNYFVCPKMESCVQQLIEYRNFTVMEKVECVENLVNLRQSKIHKLTEVMLTFSVSILTNKGNPLAAELNKLVVLTFQSGLLNKWEKEVSWLYHYKKNFEFKTDEDNLPFDIHDLQGAFGILFGGLALSVFVYLGETLLYQRKQRNKAEKL
ncbi:hypothetical protein J6590_005623 [Homalodisca vitripennis]|nr:hypothetical protein J6590_005623 [Homalodisca vitripennis]